MAAADPVYAVGPSLDYAARRRFALAAGAGLVVLAALAFDTRAVTIPGIGWLSAALLLVSALASLGAGVLLLGLLPVERGPSVTLLAWWTLGSGAVAFCTLLFLPYSPDQPPVFLLQPQTGVWLHTFWRVYVAIGALVYAALRSRAESLRRGDARTVAAVGAGALGIAAGGTVLTIALAPHLPPLTDGLRMDGLRSSGVGAAQLLLGALAMAAVWHRPQLRRLDHAVALGVLANWLALGVVVIADLERGTLGYCLARVIDSLGPAFIVIAASRRLIDGLSRLGIAATVIDRTQRVALRQTQRLAAIWRLARDEHLDDTTWSHALLDAAAGAMRPGRPFFGEIGHLEGDVLVIDAASGSNAPGDRRALGSRLLHVGARVPLDQTLHYEIAQAGTTISFSDLDEIDHDIRRRREHSAPFTSFIGTVFAIGSTSYFVAFASTESMRDDQFTEDDHAFVDVLASFLATHLQHDRQLAQIRYQIEHDHLTGLPARAKFRAAALKNISLEIPCAVAIVALDRFREINETFGHMIGDAMLVEIAAALRASRQSGDFVARLGGDNFALLIDDVAGGIDLDARLRPYRDIFTRPFLTGDRDGKERLRVSASFGVALYPQDARTFDELLARADAAVDVAKARQRGSIEYFNTRLQESIERRRSLHVELTEAVEKQQFTVHYQPTVELWNQQIIGAEALVRWQHPREGMIVPDQFIPFAEANGLIRPIGAWVMQRVVGDLGTVGTLPAGFHCYINLSGHQFDDPEFLAAFRDQLNRFPRLLGHIGIEITETVAMSDVGRTLDALAQLRELGITVALDDFGTGYSSLSYLKRFPIDVIKIDKSFVRGLPYDQHDVGLVETVIAIASRFGFKTLAEGIESVEQYDWLRSHGCTYGQGYLIAKPMTFTQFVPWLSRRTFTFVRS